MFSVFVLSYNMKISDLAIGILVCIIYIIAAVVYVISNQFWQIFIIGMIYLCHGSAVTIIISLTSKIMENDRLGRLYKLCDNMYFTKFGHFCLVILMYVILTIPILFVYMTLYSKCKDFWERDATRTLRTRQQSIYVIRT
ncbi:uncharacterized protein LOC103309798 isoform X1 [Acyrthosiphon pisum]|uniref:Uncharacterized protein n=1 Tax=Acyrthosiphon pisum TaxID=7029 RepID=A0A8R2NN59_ACYPI|nr:uncharacterized protein LOC103309798 isoform X1 [Acyrthosiphon pisum]